MEPGPSWEAICRSAAQEILNILWNPKVYYNPFDKSPNSKESVPVWTPV